MSKIAFVMAHVNILLDQADLHQNLAEYDITEKKLTEALDFMKEKIPNSPYRVSPIIKLAGFYLQLGRLDAAELLIKEALTLVKEMEGDKGLVSAGPMSELVSLKRRQGKFRESELIAREVVEIRERFLGHKHELVASALHDLAYVLFLQGRHAESENLNRRALRIREEVYGPNHPEVGYSLNNLGLVLKSTGRLRAARTHLEQSLSISKSVFGLNHAESAVTLINIGELDETLGNLDESWRAFETGLEVYRSIYGPDHPSVASALLALGRVSTKLRRLEQAEGYLTEALALSKTAFGPDHRQTAYVHQWLSGLYELEKRWDLALEHVRAATRIFSRQATRDLGASGRDELKRRRPSFLRHLKLLLRRLNDLDWPPSDARQDELLTEGVKAMQFAQTSDAGVAVSRMASRFAAGDSDLAKQVRVWQDATNQLEAAEAAMLPILSKSGAERNATAETALKKRIALLRERLSTISDDIDRKFPQFRQLASPAPIDRDTIQDLLRENEGIIAFAMSIREAFVFAANKTESTLVVAPLSRQEISVNVQALRAGLDPTRVDVIDDLYRFDAAAAYEVFQGLFAPVMGVLADVDHLFAVPVGPLQSLPLGVLLTEPPDGLLDSEDKLRDAPWLANQFAITTLPSISALRALRVFAKTSSAKRPFLGVGDPLLNDHPGAETPIPDLDAHGPEVEDWLRSFGGEDSEISVAGLFRGTGADLSQVRNVPALPDTAAELLALARASGSGVEDLILRDMATEANVRQAAAMQDSRVVVFATHGLVSGELPGLSEPALVLTPPLGQKAPEDNDGLLTASEIATSLKLDANWVILSACNTAAPGAPGAEGLSGLASAFFYAGARTLFVSHWPVVSDATVKLTTSMFQELRDNPGIGRAEAHRRAMQALREDLSNPMYAHPLFWAPFVVVGEGGRFATAGR